MIGLFLLFLWVLNDRFQISRVSIWILLSHFAATSKAGFLVGIRALTKDTVRTRWTQVILLLLHTRTMSEKNRFDCLIGSLLLLIWLDMTNFTGLTVSNRKGHSTGGTDAMDIGRITFSVIMVGISIGGVWSLTLLKLFIFCTYLSRKRKNVSTWMLLFFSSC